MTISQSHRKVKVTGQNKWHHWIYWPEKHKSWYQNCHPRCLSSKVMAKTSFYITVANITCSSHVQTTQDIFCVLKGPNPSYPLLKLCNNLSSRKQDMAQMWFYNVVALKGEDYPWRSKSLLSDLCHLLVSTQVKLHWNLISVDQSARKSSQEKEERTKVKQSDMSRHFLTQITPWRSDLT